MRRSETFLTFAKILKRQSAAFSQIFSTYRYRRVDCGQQGADSTLSTSSSKLYVTPRCWKQLVRKMPIPCVDTIVYRGGKILLGWRTILPYRNVWALLGGRMLYGESFEDTSKRNCKESGLTVHQPEYLGIFPIKFPSGRHDLVLCMSAKYIRGEPRPTRELSKYVWTTKDAADEIHPIGGNYLKMLRRWWKSQNA